jgi:hypothetical protein
MATFTRPRLTKAQFFSLQCKERLTPAEHQLLSRAEIIDENAASMETLNGFLGAIGGAQ